MAGWGKVLSPVWTGSQSGVAVRGFLTGALAKTTGEHPDVSSWYAFFINHFAMNHTVLLSYLVAYGEVAVGVGLILGLFVGITSFFGMTMNFNYLFAGTTSVNPLFILLELLLLLAWRTSGYIGLDRFMLPKVLRKNSK
jgi:thiosulfate dehydrogenase [quinone] large subunit